VWNGNPNRALVDEAASLPVADPREATLRQAVGAVAQGATLLVVSHESVPGVPDLSGSGPRCHREPA
jgi:hypothetical protein